VGERVFDVVVRREPPGYWAQVTGLEGCFASADTLDELVAALAEAISLYLGDEEPYRILCRITGLRMEIETDLHPDDPTVTGRPRSRRREPHRDDWPPRRPRQSGA
jgi:predicted RNase H-like HicB family nuclease